MKHATVDVHNIADLISKLEAHRTDGVKIWFRGHSKSEWVLSPSIARDRIRPIDDEFRFYKQFKQEAARVIKNTPTDEWGWIFLMQHYGVPTRLLDFTENPLVALYFAVCKNPESDGSLFLLEPCTWNSENGYTGISVDDIPSCGVDEAMDPYLISSVIKARGANSNAVPLAATGSRNSMRIFAQEGVFVIFNENMAIDVDDQGCKSVWKYNIPAADKVTLINHLALLSITEYSVFPELDKLAKKIVESYV